jgi:hypothetical protein
MKVYLHPLLSEEAGENLRPFASCTAVLNGKYFASQPA